MAEQEPRSEGPALDADERAVDREERGLDPDERALGPDAAWSRRVRRFRSGLLGALAAGAPAAVLLVDGPGWGAVGSLVIAALVLGATAIVQGRGGTSRTGVILAVAAALPGLAPTLLARPGWAFGLGALVLTLVSWRRRPSRRGGLDAVDPAALPVWGAIGPSAAVALTAALAPDPPTVFVLSAHACAGFTLLLGGVGLTRLGIAPQPARWAWAVWGAAALGGLLSPDLGLRAALWVLGGGVVIAADRSPGGGPFSPMVGMVLGRPELMLASSFGFAIVVGAVLLALPASGTRAGVPPIDAFFTAVSATCVTGLATLDTELDFTRFGQAIILSLIQLGGLGIMTFSTAALFVLRRRPSLRHERALADVFVSWEGRDPSRAVRQILTVTFAAEGLGALLLAARFATHHDDGLGVAIWRGLFTAVSAFCNAGFALQSDSLVPYRSDPLVLVVVGTLIFVGALGPVAVVALRDGASRRMRLSVRLVLQTSALLTLVGGVLILVFEWTGGLADLGTADRVLNALFQSVTLRTAGFNSIDIGDLRPETHVLMLTFMFIGGAPGSTAGGVKTTTFVMIVLSVAAAVRGRPAVIYGGRRISHDTFYRATAILVLGLGSVVFLWWALLLTQSVAPLDALFEAVSALGTVGLTVGATGQLDEVGKILVAVGMFAGRLGPVTVLFLFASKRPPPRWKHPEIELPVG